MSTTDNYMSEQEIRDMYNTLDKESLVNILVNRVHERQELDMIKIEEYNRGVEDGKIIAEHGTTMWQE